MRIYYESYEPKVLIADAAPAITNGFGLIFTHQHEVVMCFAHVITNINKQKFAKDMKEQIKADVRALHAAHSHMAYTNARILFEQKYEKECPEFCNYMIKVWLDKNWYEGVRHFTPSTNNALEGTNAILKRDYTFRERQKLEVFKHTLLETVSAMSKRNSTEKPFEEDVFINNEDWVSAQNWINAEKQYSADLSDKKKPKYYLQPTNSVVSAKHFSRAVQIYQKGAWKD